MGNVFMYKFEIIESIVKELEFTTKEEVVRLAKKMKDIAMENKEYTKEIKEAFEDAYSEIASEELTLENLLEIKKLLK
jgi:hypothetical protein